MSYPSDREERLMKLHRRNRNYKNQRKTKSTNVQDDEELRLVSTEGSSYLRRVGKRDTYNDKSVRCNLGE